MFNENSWNLQLTVDQTWRSGIQAQFLKRHLTTQSALLNCTQLHNLDTAVIMPVRDSNSNRERPVCHNRYLGTLVGTLTGSAAWANQGFTTSFPGMGLETVHIGNVYPQVCRRRFMEVTTGEATPRGPQTIPIFGPKTRGRIPAQGKAWQACSFGLSFGFSLRFLAALHLKKYITMREYANSTGQY